jgi:hypothetical protein
MTTTSRRCARPHFPIFTGAIVSVLLLGTVALWGGKGTTPITGVGGSSGSVSVTNVAAGRTLFVDAANGNDTSAARGNMTRPFLTVTAAVAAAQSGDLVLIRPGTYAVTPSIVNSNGLGAINLFSRTNITIAGTGDPNLTVIDGSGALGDVLWITNCSGINIHNLRIRGMMLTNYVLYTSNHQWAGINVYACEKMEVSGNIIDDHFNHGMWDAAAQSGWHTASTNQIWVHHNVFRNTGSSRTNWVLATDGTAIAPTGWTVENNWFEDNWRAIEPYDETDGRVFKNCIIRNNFIHNTLEKGITTAGSTNGHHITIEGNHIWNDRLYSRRGTNTYAQSAGIYINAGLGHSIRNNTIRDIPGYGIVVGGGRIFDVAVTGNHIDRITNGASGFGIVIGGEAGTEPPVTRFHVSGNRIRQTDTVGIYVTGAEYGLIDDNIVEWPTIFGANMGISIGTRTTNITVHGNQVHDSTGTMQDGIVIHANSHNTYVAFNRISGHTSSEINDSGVGTVTRTFGESLGSGTTNNVVQAVRFLSLSNNVDRIRTNITSTTPTIDWNGPSRVFLMPAGTFTASFTNVPTAGAAHGPVREMEVHLLTAQSGTFAVVGPATAIDWGIDGAPVIASGITNRFRFIWTGTNMVGINLQVGTSGTGNFVLATAPTILNASFTNQVAMLATNGNHAYTKVVGSNAVLVTNIVGKVNLAAAAVLFCDMNVAQRYVVTNRLSAATTVVVTNGADGQEFSLIVLGEASGGTDRVLTIVPHLGQLVADLDTFGTALAASTAQTVTNANMLELSGAINRVNGTNIFGKISRQARF